VSLSPPDSSIAVAQQYDQSEFDGILCLPLFGDITGGFNHYAGTKKPQQPKISVKPSK
jgi:hypothetical protein